MKKLSIKSILLLLILLCINLSFTQNKTVSFNHLSAKDGLSQNGVMAIYKDAKGFMWFGTRDGLNRYDGYSFKIFKHNDLDPNSISNNFITVITEDNKGTLWIGTENGLNAFNSTTETFKVYKNEVNDNRSISDNKIQCILSCKNGDFWVGTENGLNLKSKHTDSFERFYNITHNPNSLSDNQINTLFEDAQKNVWVGTQQGGLNKLVKNTKQFTRYSHDASNPKSIASNDVRTITESKDHIMWIGTTDNGISVLNKDNTFTHIQHDEKSTNSLSNNRIRHLIFDELDNLWIATYNGLNYLNTKDLKFEVYKNSNGNSNSISHNSIRSLYLDNSEFLWAGTYFGGLNLLNLKSKQFTHYQHNPTQKNSLSYNVVGAMVEDEKGNVWIGTEGGGLNYFDLKKQSFSKTSTFYGKYLKSKTIKSLLIDRNQNLWIGTHLEGLYILNFKTHQLIKYINKDNDLNSISNNSVVSLIEDHTGKIWIGTESGLNLFNPDTSLMTRVQLQNNNSPITTIHEDSKNNIWVGTKQNGLVLIESETIKYYFHDKDNLNTISHNTIYDIFEDSKNNIWIGTYGGGLNLLNKTDGTFRKYRTRDGIVNEIIYKIEEDSHNNLWMSTPGGISKFNSNSKEFKNYTPSNGLPVEEFNIKSSLNHSNGSLFFGGFNGMISFNPEEIKDSPFVPSLRINGLKLANNTIIPNDESGLLHTHISDTKSLNFSHDQNIFTIDFIAINYEQLGQNQYAYMLEGLETDWNYVGNKRSATYTNLTAGDYTFKVKAANNDGVWNENIVTLNIIKRPPYWKTTWAYLIYILLVIGIFFVIRKYFLIKLHLENNLKLEKLEKQQIEDLTKLKLKFFTNISHDFRTPLTLIHGPLQELLVKFQNHEANSHLTLIKKNVNLMLRLINQLMDFRKLQTSTLSLHLIKEPIVPFIKEIMFSFQELAKTQKIKFMFISRVENKALFFDKDKIEKILYNLLSNAFNHTPSDGKITVEIQTKYASTHDDIDFLEIRIRNSGHGIEKEILDNIFDRFFQGYDHAEQTQSGSGVGLSLVKNLIELHKGYITAQSELEKFAEFTIGIPLNDIYSNEEKSQTKSLKDSENSSKPISYKASPSINKEDKPHTILIIEDNLDLRNFLAQTLASQYNIITAENGEIGLSKAYEHKPDIILSDIMMPKMNGLELCKTLKSDSKTNHIPIILLTARTASSVELDSYETGANDFISKPFNVEVLKSKIHSLIHSMHHIKNYSRKEVLLEDVEINNNSADEKFLEKLSTYIRDNITDPDLNVNKTGKELGMSRVHLYRKVKAITGKSPVEFIRNFRLSVAAKLLEQNNYNINEVSYKVGFQDVSYFRKCFKKKYGVSSTKYAERETEISINE